MAGNRIHCEADQPRTCRPFPGPIADSFSPFFNVLTLHHRVLSYQKPRLNTMMAETDDQKWIICIKAKIKDTGKDGRSPFQLGWLIFHPFFNEGIVFFGEIQRPQHLGNRFVGMRRPRRFILA